MVYCPEMDEASPATVVTKTRTARVLTPALVLAAISVVGGTATAGIAIAGSILCSTELRSGGLTAAEVFLLVASISSAIYTLLHIAAAIENMPIGPVRPPINTTHAMCHLFARISLLFWVVSLVAACIVFTTPSACIVGSHACGFQLVGIIISALALLALGIITTAHEACHLPFQVPAALRCGMASRGSGAGEDLYGYGRNASQTSLYQHANGTLSSEKPQIPIQPPKHMRKPEPIKTSHIPGEWLTQERPLTPLLPSLPKRSRSLAWGREWTYGLKRVELKDDGSTCSDSAISMSMSASVKSSRPNRSSAGSRCARSSTVSGGSSSVREADPRRTSTTRASNRPRSQKPVTPTSSIKNKSRRSPLSTVRCADFPELAIRPTLQYTPPIIPPPHEWRLSRTASISQLLPMAGVQYLHHQPSNMDAPIRLRGPQAPLPPLRHMPSTSSTMRRNTVGSIKKIPQMYEDFHEKELEEHMKKIEKSIDRSLTQRRNARAAFVRAQAKRATEPPLNSHRTKQLECPSPRVQLQGTHGQTTLNSRASHHDVQAVKRSHTTAGETRMESPRFEDAPEVVAPEQLRPLRRLSLGSLPTGIDMGMTWMT